MTTHAKKWIGGIILLLFLLCLTPLIISWRMKCVATSMQMKMPSTGVSIYKELRLSDAQQKQIQDLDAKYQKQMVDLCAKHCAAKMKVSQLLQSQPIDKQVLQVAQREVIDVYSASEEETLQHILQISDVLRPDQKAVFLKKIGEQIQATCPMQFVR